MSNVDQILNKILKESLESEISSLSQVTSLTNLNKIYLSKVSRAKNYVFKDNYMNSYGTPILDKNKNLIGYKLNDVDHASIRTYYNDKNLLCNEVSIKQFDEISKRFFGEVTASWIDIKTGEGYTR